MSSSSASVVQDPLSALRACVYQAPSVPVWLQIGDVLDAIEPPGLLEVACAYVAAHTASWPAALTTPRLAWVRAGVSCPMLRVCRAWTRGEAIACWVAERLRGEDIEEVERAVEAWRRSDYPARSLDALLLGPVLDERARRGLWGDLREAPDRAVACLALSRQAAAWDDTALVQALRDVGMDSGARQTIGGPETVWPRLAQASRGVRLRPCLCCGVTVGPLHQGCRRVYTFDGAGIDSAEAFHRRLGEAVHGPWGYFGVDFDTFYAALLDGAHLSPPFTLRLRRMDAAREALGHGAMAAWLRGRLAQAHAGDAEAMWLRASLEAAEAGVGQTYLEMVVDALRFNSVQVVWA